MRKGILQRFASGRQGNSAAMLGLLAPVIVGLAGGTIDPFGYASLSPRLVLNTDYDQTDVPVPEGLGPTGRKLRLAR